MKTTMGISKVFIILLLIFVSLPVYAQDSVLKKVEELISNATYVVQGKSLSFKSYNNDKGTAVFTDMEFEITEVFKGDTDTKSGNIIIVKLPGGTIDKKSVLIIGAPSFKINEEAILFLNKINHKGSVDDGKYYIIWLSQGKYNIYINDKGENVVISDSDIHEGYSYGYPETINVYPSNNISLTSFIEIIKSCIK